MALKLFDEAREDCTNALKRKPDYWKVRQPPPHCPPSSPALACHRLWTLELIRLPSLPPCLPAISCPPP